MEKILYEYVYKCEIGYTFKKQLCINDNKKVIFNFIVNDNFSNDLLLSNINNDFKDNTLNIKIKDYLLNILKDLVNIKTLGLCLKGVKCDIEILKNGIKINDKVFRLKNNDYHTLQYQLLDYISALKNNVK